MINKNRFRPKNKMTPEKLKEMIQDKGKRKEMENYIDNGLSYKEFEMLMGVFREIRMARLFNDLNIDENRLKKAKDTTVRLHPNSTEWPLLSALYRNRNGNYKVETLINQYHDSILQEGILIGMDYGKKFIIEDLQNRRFSKQDVMNMSNSEISEYCEENRQEV